MTKSVICYFILGLMLVGCTFDTVFNALFDEPDNTLTTLPTVIPTPELTESPNCYDQFFLQDRGIRIGSQAIVQSSADFYLDRSSLTPDASLSSNETVTILQGPFCFYTRNQQNRWWQVRVDSSGQVGYIDEYVNSIGVLQIHLSPSILDNNTATINYFAVSVAKAFGGPAIIGETAYVSWDVANASSVMVFRLDTHEAIGSGLHNAVPFVVPNINQISIDFTIVVTALDGQIIEETRTLQIDCSSCQPATDIPVPDNVIIVQLSYQPFEGGFMLYRTDTSQIFVINYNGTAQIFSDSWQGETYTDEAPDGYFVPQFGFGEIWTNVGGIRDVLGWATSQETYYTANVITSDASGIEIQLPDASYVAINAGLWQYKSH